MDKFIVSARKYRPQNFATVVGQEHITTTLKNSIKNNTLAHAFLFCGPRGVGKTTCARILAKTINCDNIQADGEACNACVSCKSFNEGASLNVHELDAASNNKVDEMRDLISQVRFAPQEGKYKIYIIDEVHMLSTSAFNAFLKTLEEPPAHAKFILATTEKHKIIPTILSRCQIFDFKRITNADVTAHLAEIAAKENVDYEKQALQVISQKSEGCMRDALSIFDKIVSFSNSQVTFKETLEHLNILDEDVYFVLLDHLLQQNLAGALLLFDEINQKGFEGNTVLEGLCAFFRNLMVSKDAKAAKLLDVLEGMQNRYAKVAQGVSLSYLVSALHIAAEALQGFREAQNKRLHVEMTLVKLTYLQQALSVVSDSSGKLVSKRRVDSPVLIKSKPVELALMPLKAHPVQKRSNEKEARLVIETRTADKGSAPRSIEEVNLPVSAEVLSQPAPAPIREKYKPVTAPEGTYTKPVSSPSSGEGMSLYEKIKLRYQETAQNGKDKEVLPVREPELQEVYMLWNAYRDRMKAEAKHTTATSFDLAELALMGNEVQIQCSNSFSKKCIDDELAEFGHSLKMHFNNQSIVCDTVIETTETEEPKEQGPDQFNARERYRLMSEEYPLVKELKEKLKLNIGY